MILKVTFLLFAFPTHEKITPLTCPTLLTLVFWWLPVPKSTSLAWAMSHVVGFVYPDLWQRSIQLVSNQIMSFIWKRLVSGTFHFYLLWSCLKFTINIQYFFSSVAQSCPALWDPMDCSTPGLPVHHQVPEFTQTHVHWVGKAIQPSYPLLSPFPPAFNLSQHQGLYKWVSSSHQVAKYWSFSFNIHPFNEHPGLISFRMDWLDLLAVQGTLKSLLQHHSSKASVLRCSAFFIVQSHIHTWLLEKP